MHSMRPTRTLVLALFSLGMLAGNAAAQSLALPTTGVRQKVTFFQVPDPNSPEQKAITAFNKEKREAEKELSRIRLKHFGAITKVDIRQEGLVKIRKFTSAPALAAMVEVLHEEGADVRGAVLDHLADQKTEGSDAALAWAAVFDSNRLFRGEASERIARRAKLLGEVPMTAQKVVASGLATGKAEHATAAGKLAGMLKLIEAIPMMAAAQVGPAGGGGWYGGQPDTPDQCLAYIVVGTQRSFVSDLTPVVGESAVAFDPQVGVITEGVVLRVINAFVFEYNGDLHNELLAMSSQAWGGQETASLGWDAKKWQTWYDTELKPYLAKKDAEKKVAEEKASAAA